jgi:hypothetical protein
LGHDPEKSVPVLRKDHGQTKDNVNLVRVRTY